MHSPPGHSMEIETVAFKGGLQGSLSGALAEHQEDNIHKNGLVNTPNGLVNTWAEGFTV